jgi:hypothetical protein
MEMTNKTRNKLKERLKYTQKWAEHFLDVEKHRSISKNARKALNKDRPFLGFIFIILYLPSRLLDFILSMFRWNRYRKAQKEIEIIRKELKIDE